MEYSDKKSRFGWMPSIDWIERHLGEMFDKAQGDPFGGNPPTMTFEQGLRAWQCAVSSSLPMPGWSGVVARAGKAEEVGSEEQGSKGCCGSGASQETSDHERRAAPGRAETRAGGVGGAQYKDSGPAKKKQLQERSLPSDEGSVDSKDEERCERCGPDVTEWLLDELNKNKNHPVIKTMRENKDWVRWIPFFNLGFLYGFLSAFRDLVKSGGPRDYKSSQTFKSAHCPIGCKNTITLCNYCFFYDVPGNINYGWVGRAAGLRPWFLHNRAAAAQAGGVDDPKDTQAIDIGINMWDSPDNGNIAYLCPRVRMKRYNLALRDCPICTEVYRP